MLTDADYDKAMAMWRMLAARVDEMAKRCGADPVYLASLDLDIPANAPMTGILRACAAKIMPGSFTWDVVETIGGHAYVVLKSLNEVADIETTSSGA